MRGEEPAMKRGPARRLARETTQDSSKRSLELVLEPENGAATTGLGVLNVQEVNAVHVAVQVHNTQVGVVESVEEVRAELDLMAFRHLDTLHDGEVVVLLAGVVEAVAAEVAHVAAVLR